MAWYEKVLIFVIVVLAVGAVGFGIYHVTSGRISDRPKSTTVHLENTPRPEPKRAEEPAMTDNRKSVAVPDAPNPARKEAPSVPVKNPGSDDRPIPPSEGTQQAAPEKNQKAIAEMTVMEILDYLNVLLKEGRREEARAWMDRIVKERPDALQIFGQILNGSSSKEAELLGAYGLMQLYITTAGTDREPAGLKEFVRISLYPRLSFFLSFLHDHPELKMDTMNVINKMIKFFGSDPRAVQALADQLKDQDSEVRGEAAIILGNATDPVVVPILISIYLAEENRQTRSFILWSLGNFDPAHLQSFIPEVRKQMEGGDVNATIAMANWGEKKAGPPLVQWLPTYANDQYNGTIVSWALVKLDDHELIPQLKKVMESKDLNTRINAAYVLAYYGDSSGKELLTEVAEKKNFKLNLTVYSMLALAKLGDQTMRPHLERFVKSGDPRLANHARKLLDGLNASTK